MTRLPPTAPPPFGAPPGAIGGSYDWWWWNFGRPSGMPYRPHPETVTRNGRTLGFGQSEELSIPLALAAVHPSPWLVALTTSVVGAAAGWTIEEIAKRVRRRGRR